jgi:hypothetical protein
MTTEAGKVRRFVHMREGMVEVLQTYGNDAILIDFANRACNPSDMFFHKSDYEALEKHARELEADAARWRAIYSKTRDWHSDIAICLFEGSEWTRFFDPEPAIDAAVAAEGEENE